MGIQRYHSHLEKQEYAASTIQSYKSIATQYEDYVRGKKKSGSLSKTVTQWMTDFLNFKRLKVTESTFRKNYAGLHQYFLFLQQEKKITDTASYPRIDLPKVELSLPPLVTEVEVREIAKEIPVESVSLAVLIMFYTGVRLNECLNIRRRDINFKKKTLNVTAGKGGKERVVDLPRKVSMDIRNYLNQRAKEETTNRIGLDDFLISTSRTRQVSASYVHFLLQQAQKNLQRTTIITAHDLRHSYAHWHLAEKNDLLLLQKQLGHASLGTTERYLSHTIKELHSQQTK